MPVLCVEESSSAAPAPPALKMVVQGGCRDSVGFSRVAASVWEGPRGEEDRGEAPKGVLCGQEVSGNPSFQELAHITSPTPRGRDHVGLLSASPPPPSDTHV